MTRRLYRRYLQGYKIYTNYKVNFPHEKLDAIRLMEMGEDLQNCAIGIDELHVLIDSRAGPSARNRLISYFILQTRKRNVVLFGTTQEAIQIDIRLRLQVDYWVVCNREGKTTWFRYTVYRGVTFKKVKKCRYDGTEYFAMYDTKETITDFLSPLDEAPRKPRTKRPTVTL